MSNFTIGYTNPRNYNLDKILLQQPPKEVKLKFIISPSSYIISRLGGFKGSVYPKILLPFPKVSLIHSLWAPILNKTPWILSFSSYLPYFSEKDSKYLYDLSIKAIKSKYCRKLMPTSENTYNILKDKYFFDEEIESKAEIVNYAYTDVHRNRPLKPSNRDKLRLLFIGHHFFRKGGDILVSLFNELKNHFNIELTIISRIEADDWLTKTSKKDEDEMKNKLTNSSGIDWINSASYKNIVEKFLPEADIFVLPTWGDNWGHVLCEALSAGLPVISTKIRAIPEIVQHDVNGLLIDLPVDKHGVLYTNKLNMKEPDYFKTAREENLGKMKETFKNYLIKLLQSKDIRTKFGHKSRKLFEEKFTYEVRNKKLIEIYKNASI